MITVKLGHNVHAVTLLAAIHISNLILDSKRDNYVFGTVVINDKELTFYKWALKMGSIPYTICDLTFTPYGAIDYVGSSTPIVHDSSLFQIIERFTK